MYGSNDCYTGIPLSTRFGGPLPNSGYVPLTPLAQRFIQQKQQQQHQQQHNSFQCQYQQQSDLKPT
jgi:hypothetical protein